MKHEWRKEEKEIYLPKQTPTILEIPKMKCLTISGEGNPNNNQDFGSRIEALYSLSYAIKMMPKKGYTPDGYFEYTVYPLEGIWSLNEEGKNSEVFNKDNLIYKIMIRQPEFVTDEVFYKALENTKQSKNNPLLDEVTLEEITDGFCIQMLHIGPYDDEPKTFAQMEQFMNENNYEKRILEHKEIYLSNFNKTAPEKLKTVLRYFIKKKEADLWKQ